MVLQQFVDEAVAATDTLEQHTLGAVVEETGVIPGDVAVTVKDEAESKVFNTNSTAN
ncbi:hypothetical protein DSM107007_54280 [Nostoc sp. PCC 7120 = FACHB-418]|nr:hypothetical protein DSM107007_54280 [Nostoc sp. PCC 7120 = FACHB-418]